MPLRPRALVLCGHPSTPQIQSEAGVRTRRFPRLDPGWNLDDAELRELLMIPGPLPHWAQVPGLRKRGAPHVGRRTLLTARTWLNRAQARQLKDIADAAARRAAHQLEYLGGYGLEPLANPGVDDLATMLEFLEPVLARLTLWSMGAEESPGRGLVEQNWDRLLDAAARPPDPHRYQQGRGGDAPSVGTGEEVPSTAGEGPHLVEGRPAAGRASRWSNGVEGDTVPDGDTVESGEAGLSDAADRLREECSRAVPSPALLKTGETEESAKRSCEPPAASEGRCDADRGCSMVEAVRLYRLARGGGPGRLLLVTRLG